MEIPPRSVVTSRAVPWVSLWLGCMNTAVFLYTLSLGADASAFLDRWGVVPRELFGGSGAGLASIVSPLSAMFLHAGWLHLASNLFYLWIFGPAIEERLGWRRFAVFYVACGLTALAIQVASDPSAFIPTIGASGAVSGLLGAYAAYAPSERLRLFWPAIRIPATLLLVLWVVAQILSALGSGVASVASWAHLGGFLAGLIGIRWGESLREVSASRS